MKIQAIIDAILAYHPDIGSRRTCDVIIGADPNVECSGILVSIAPTVDILRKAIELNANFILVHEPTFYSGYDNECDWLQGDPVYEEKLQLLLDNGIVIFRDHDHLHAHRPDGIFHYMLRQLGWSEYVVPGEGMAPEIRLPETTFGDLLKHVKTAMGLETIRYIGNLEAKVSTVGFCGHLLPNERTNWSNNDQVAASWKYDVVIPGEVVEWTLPLYIQDAAMLGKAKGMILPGHFIQEEAGMRWAEEWLRPIIGEELAVTFVSAGDMFQYL
ncbi:MAG: Nif3-like dinuclear metal center hexameric protein [Anaerolineae bacterium]|jgi:putative NIF3 family GTP cyclohydrolase 1 type 2|nr:Nif3-like dinuclear metal center hexameric protein [Anaerolineae bacterium]